jgi:hypothetical protein
MKLTGEVQRRNRDNCYMVLCPECDAWHQVAVLARAELFIRPGVYVRPTPDWSQSEVVCAGCHQGVEFLLQPAWREEILAQAVETK